jgi:hypothetical protein
VWDIRRAVLYSGVGDGIISVEVAETGKRRLEWEGDKCRRTIGDVDDRVGMIRTCALSFEKSLCDPSTKISTLNCSLRYNRSKRTALWCQN